MYDAHCSIANFILLDIYRFRILWYVRPIRQAVYTSDRQLSFTQLKETPQVIIEVDN